MTATELLSLSVGLLLCGALLAVVVRGWRPELALCLSVGVGVLVAGLVLRQMLPLLSAIQRLAQSGGMTEGALSVVLRAVGICLVTQMAADTCRDAGESALAGKAELVGRVLLLALTIPLLEQILSLATGLLAGLGVSG